MSPDAAQPPKTVVLIANPHAGRGEGRVARGEVAAALRQAEIGLEVAETTGPGHAVELARDAAARDDVDAVAALGGDGTLHEVLNGVLEARRQRPPALGVIPVGGGNDYARMLGVPGDDPVEATRIVARGHTRAVDVGRLEGASAGAEYFLNNVGLAFMGTANAARDVARALPGKLSYLVGGAAAFLRFGADTLTVEVDGVSCQGRFLIAHVGIGRYCGAGITLTPEAELDDGRFEVFLLAERSRLRAALEWRDIVAGRADDDAAILRGRRVRVMGPKDLVLHTDGEVRRSPLGVVEATLLPKAARVFHAGHRAG